jgi:hypothetical protein
MLHHTRHALAMVLVSAVGSLVLAACGGRSTTTSPGTSGAATVTSTGAGTSATAAPAKASTSTTVGSTKPPTTTVAAPTSTAGPTTTLDGAAVKAQITANWERFFLPSTSISDRAALLENGVTLQAALEQRAKDPLQQQASARVKNIDLDAPGRATVTYDVSLNGEVALPDAQGVAVLQDGVWKVSAESFCALISLGATQPIPGCG